MADDTDLRLTIMEEWYRNRYNEALAKAREIKSKILSSHLSTESCKAVSEYIDEIIPELAESEDERIRKGLIWHLKAGEDFVSNGVTKEECIAYLEKQKEHQETCTTFLAKILKHSAEGFRNVLKKKGINYIPHESFWTNTAGTFSKQECNEFYKWMDDMTMELVTEETPEYKKGFKDGLDASKKEQKPVEPSDEELQRHQDELTEFKKFATKQAKENQLHISYTRDVMWENFCSELLSFVNSRKPVEWSEEDEEMIRSILFVLESYVSKAECEQSPALTATYPTYYKEIDWLKSLRPSWKPSEEQIEALDIIVKYGDKESSHIKCLRELIDQLREQM